MTERSHAAEPVVAFEGAVLQEAWHERLVEAVVETATHLPDTAELRFSDPDHQLLAAARIAVGRTMTVAVAAERQRTRTTVFDGEVTALETEVAASGTFTVVRAMDRGHRLMRGRRVAAYVNRTVAEIAAEAARRHGLRTGRIEAEAARVPHLAQPNLTDWELLAHLADDRGLHLAVEGQELTMRRLRPAAEAPAPSTGADRSPFVLQYRANLLALRATVSSLDQVGTVEVRGWDEGAKAPVVAKESATDSTRVRIGTSPGKLGQAFGGPGGELLVTGRPYTTAQEVSAAARALAADTAAAVAGLEATVAGTPQLRAGCPVTVTGTGEPFAGRYTTTACRHTFDGTHGYLTQVRVGALPPPVVPSPPPLCGLGVAVGIVSDIKEPGRGQRGAVRLRLPWLSEDYVTDWVRTVQWGGAGGGGVVGPETGDEVLVGFEHGRLDRPYVLGGLYNGKDAPTPHEEPLIDGNTGRANRSSVSSRAGDRLELLSAAKGPQGVRLKSGDGKLTAHLNRKDTAITLSAGEVGKALKFALDAPKRTITLDAGTDGEIVITAGKITLRAGGETITLDGQGGKLTIDSTTTKVTGASVDIN
ncbi:VgrG-related protein [Streptomyces sp. NPDC047049]|uniref:VgrG-related protein n=1 Tax=Streptomyces sp. NPDC047049 TaxID=3156688 RepID=UPI0033F0020F